MCSFFVFRKFADIEAANHRLASALYLKADGKNVSSLSSQEPETLEESNSLSPDPGESTVHTAADGISNSEALIGSRETEKKQPESGHLWKRHPKSQAGTCNNRKNYQSKAGQTEESRNVVEMTRVSSPTDYQHEAWRHPAQDCGTKSPLKSANNFSEEITQQDSGSTQFSQNTDVSPVFSPGLCPLSLDSCDFSFQMFTDMSTCRQAQKNMADVEGRWKDVMDLLSVGTKNVGGHVDVEAYFESICACQGDAGQDAGVDDDFGFAEQSESFTETICSNTSDYVSDDGHSCRGVQGLATNQSAPRQNKDAAETHFDYFNPSHGTIQNQLPTSTCHQQEVSELHTCQHPQHPCMLVNNQNFTPFEGVAQSFTAPPHHDKHRPMPTPPHEDDWLFTDILTDRMSPDRHRNVQHVSSFY